MTDMYDQTYYACEDIAISTDIADDDPVSAAERANARFTKAWEIMEAALQAHPELGVTLNGRYDDDLLVYDEDHRQVYGG